MFKLECDEPRQQRRWLKPTNDRLNVRNTADEWMQRATTVTPARAPDPFGDWPEHLTPLPSDLNANPFFFYPTLQGRLQVMKHPLRDRISWK